MAEKEFDYKEIDREGHDTLDVIGKAGKFNRWMYETIKPYLKGNVLEIGSGIGNITKMALEDGLQVTASDIRDNYCRILEEDMGSHPNLRGVRKIDIVHPSFDIEYADLLGQFDSLFALNIVEHVKNDQLALTNCGKLLRKGGQLVILVPAFQALYNRFDAELEHFRRYTKNTLEKLFAAAGLSVNRSIYFNAVGIAGWWFTGSILRKKTIPEGQMGLYNLLVPVFKLVDACLGRTIGLSVICFGTKE